MTISERPVLLVAVLLAIGAPARAQVDQARAAAYLKEAAELCGRDAGTLWGVSLCGPIVMVDPTTRTIATNQPIPDAPRPAVLGYANAALDWGGTRWTSVVWQLVPTDRHLRMRLLIHELFHRIQPQLGLFVRDLPNDHLDTLEGRYWLQLEWRALSAALRQPAGERTAAVRDALAFRAKRRTFFGGAAESERLLEIQEGLAQYTGTLIASGSTPAAEADAAQQLDDAPKQVTFVRTFAYPSGAAYGLLLDQFAPGWRKKIKGTDDLAQLLMTASALSPAADPMAAAKKYGGEELRASEAAREEIQKERLAELRKKYVDGPVLVLPFVSGGSFVSAGMTPLPGAGTVYPGYRVTGEWGTLEASNVLISSDRSTLTLPAPRVTEGSTISGDGWTLRLAPGWSIRPGARAGDFQIVKGGR